MKSVCKITILCFVLSIILGNYTYALGEDKPKIAVMNLNAEGVSQVEANAVSEFLRNDLIDTNMFQVIERTNMEQILNEQGFQRTGCTEQSCAVEMGNILNVQKVVVGSLIKLGTKLYIN